MGEKIIPILLDNTALPEPLGAFQWIDLRKRKPHGGLVDFVYLTFQPSGRHYYPKDEYGEYRDWDHEEFMAREWERKKAWEKTQEPLRHEIARTIVATLDEGEP